ncbi:unnamed protein product, partial [Staurois parvus]
MIWVPTQNRGLDDNTSLYTLNVLRVWDIMHRQKGWVFNSLLMPLRNTEFFAPGREGITGKWIIKEDAQLRDIMVGEELGSFKELEKKKGDIFNRIDEWRYHQLKHFVGRLPKPSRTKKDWNPFERLLDSRGDGKHGIAKIYKIFTDLDTSTKLMYIEKWERDLGMEIDEGKQKKIYRLIYENISMREVEIKDKCLIRWHITP